MNQALRRALVSFSLLLLLLIFVLIGVGSWVRLSDAGLGCPDWPGCYGYLLGIPSSLGEIAAATQNFPNSPVDPARAFKEMFHRYLAAGLGLGILLQAVFAWRSVNRWLLGSSLGLVCLQAWLGMLTVTELLKPLIVDLHLLGGMATFALQLAICYRLQPTTHFTSRQALSSRLKQRHMAIGALALLVIIVQIALGGWVSSNYAALACLGFPQCNGAWWPDQFDWANAFYLPRALGLSADGELLTPVALTTIHFVHRLWALAVLVVVLGFAFSLRRCARLGGNPSLSRHAFWLTLALLLQLTLGAANVWLNLPLPLAVAHTLGAALLLALCLSAMLANTYNARSYLNL